MTQSNGMSLTISGANYEEFIANLKLVVGSLLGSTSTVAVAKATAAADEDEKPVKRTRASTKKDDEEVATVKRAVGDTATVTAPKKAVKAEEPEDDEDADDAADDDGDDEEPAKVEAEDLRVVLLELKKHAALNTSKNSKGGAEAVSAILGKFGAENLKGLKPKDYAAVMAATKKKLKSLDEV